MGYNKKISREAATEGFVLLQNRNNVLPIPKGSKIALYGAGAEKTLKGGTGSGDVNVRKTVSIYEGLKNAGYQITTEEWIADYAKTYDISRNEWKDKILKLAEDMDEEGIGAFFNIYSRTPFKMPYGGEPQKTDANLAIYVISRIAGEGIDRLNQKGDYILSDEEEQILATICSMYNRVIVVLNTGGLMDLSFMDCYENIEGLVYISQPGMEGGNAFADIVSGKVNPSGKLTDSIAFSYKDYPSSATFSHNDGDVDKELYEEGIYVGYRYFDTFQVPVRYSFGYGLSYTDFSIKTLGIKPYNFGSSKPEVGIQIKVKNIGTKFSGKEVVQAYVSCPQEKLGKEYRRLVGFQKTKLLAPGLSEIVEIRFPIYDLASYIEEAPGWMLEQGIYGVFVGNSLDSSVLAASIQTKKDILMLGTMNICPIQEEIHELEPEKQAVLQRREQWINEVTQYPLVEVGEKDIQSEVTVYESGGKPISEKAKNFVDTLSKEQLIALSTGMLSNNQEDYDGITVPGAAAQTSACVSDVNLDSLVLADGPAGLRLLKHYYVKDNKILPTTFLAGVENGFLYEDIVEPDAQIWNQYCTAMPVGTLLAQTWNLDIITEVGEAIANEMKQFNVNILLAPGMNIHRNPLCGRNFEYYSEDPLLTGKIATAMVKGIQSEAGCGATIKHFACNNQEENRMGTDSIVTERTLREIYLKGFEIVIKEANPIAIMTSYNKINGIHAANHPELCTNVAREEFGFDGVIMTDWTTTYNNPNCTASGCMRAGNDLVMPGNINDHNNLKEELEDGKLNIKDLKKSVAHLADLVWNLKEQ